MMQRPNQGQMWLLQASLFSGEAAQKAWKNWSSWIDFDRIDPASYKLLPLVSRNPSIAELYCNHTKTSLQTGRSIGGSLFEKCKGVYRRTWVENQLQWEKLLPVLSQLLNEGVDQIVLLKGMAMIFHSYRDFGMRVMGDMDILIRRSQLSRADHVLRSSGWQSKPLARFDITNPEHLKRWHALHFTCGKGVCLDLHWSFIEENSLLLDEAVFKEIRFFSAKNIGLYLPSPTDLLLQTCVHGVKYSPVPLIRWIADAMTLLKHSEKEIDWNRLVDLAAQAHICFPLSIGLQFLKDQFEASIPQAIIQQLKSVPWIRLESLEYRSYARRCYDRAAWYRYCLNRGYLTRISRILHIHKYLQSTARLKSLWQMPLFALGWIFRRWVSTRSI